MDDLLTSAYRALLKSPCAERDACLERLAARLESAEQLTAHVNSSRTVPLPTATAAPALAPFESSATAANHQISNGVPASADNCTVHGITVDGSADSLITAVLLADLVPPLLACVQQPRHQHQRTMPRDTDESNQSQSSMPQPCPLAVRLLSLLVRAAQRRLAAHGWSAHCDAATGAVWYQPQPAVDATTSSNLISAIPATTAPLSASTVKSDAASSSASSAPAPLASAAAARRAWPPTDIPTRAHEPEWAQSLLLELPALTAPLRLLLPSSDCESRKRVWHNYNTDTCSQLNFLHLGSSRLPTFDTFS
jgi:hypothetical protein